jgi:hypothetical protein
MSLDGECLPCSSRIPVIKNTRSKQKGFSRGERKRAPKREKTTDRKIGTKIDWQGASILYETSMPPVKEKRIGMRGR